MLRYTVEGYRFHNGERSGVRPEHVTKCPKGVFMVAPDESRVIVMIRDPRSILTSYHRAEKFNGRGYFMSADQCVNDTRGLLKWWAAIKRLKHAYRLRYEDLISDPRHIQRELARRFDLEYIPGRWFDEFHRGEHGQVWETALNGKRPVDSGHDWRKHRGRIDQQFAQFPVLHDVMREMGYSWM